MSGDIKILEKSNGHAKKPILPSEIGTDYTFKRKVVWFNAIGFLILHLGAAYGYVLCLLMIANPLTTIWMLLLAFLGGEGITIGAHRLYSHKAFKATTPLKIVLLILQTVSGQNCMYVWVRDHRQHHKYSDTDADPHNSNRGFFFSHIGWLMSKKHPKIFEYGHNIDMSDIEADRLVMFQKKYYKSLYMIFALAFPVAVPVWLWGEDIVTSFFVSFLGRTILQLNVTWLVNSAAHLYGTRPYDKSLQPVESWVVSLLSNGEGWHNYHHAFPWDYRASEFGMNFNGTTHIIDFFAKLGLVYDRKEASNKMVESRINRTGDGTHDVMGNPEAMTKVKTWFKLDLGLGRFNPVFTSTDSPTDQKLSVDGYPLAPSDIKESYEDITPVVETPQYLKHRVSNGILAH